MADLKPPRLAVGEAQTLRALLQYQRESLLRKVEGVDEDRARAGHPWAAAPACCG
jgi:hypothetical protein